MSPVTLARIFAAAASVVIVLLAMGGLDRRGVVHEGRGPAGLSSGENAAGADAREIQAAREAIPPAGRPLVELPGAFTDASGRLRSLAEFRGEPFFASVLYTRCPTVCPRLIAELKQLERPAGEGTAARFVLFSLDPAHDTAEVLRAFAEAHALDPASWTLLAPEPAALAAVTRALGVANGPGDGGGIAHSAVIAVVDAEGRVRRRHVGFGAPAGALGAELRAAR
jgi:protein SCO1/2